MLNLFKAVSNFVSKIIKAVTPKPSAASKPAASPSTSTRPSGFTSSQSSGAAKSSSATSGRSGGRISQRLRGSSSKPKPGSLPPIDSELLVAASGSRLGEGVLRRLQHEGKPSYVSDMDYLKAHARTGWNKRDTEVGLNILAMWDERQNRIPISNMLLAQTSTGADLTALQQRLVNLLGDDVEAQAVVEAFIANPNDPENYRIVLEEVFGYQVEFAAGFDDPDARLRQLDRLARSNLAIANYFTSRVGLDGFAIFETYFSESGQINIQLGADDVTGGAGFGLVPRFSEANRYNIFLGSEVIEATITHEFFHQLDRYFDNRLFSATDPLGLPNFLLTQKDYEGNLGLQMTPDLIRGRLNQTADAAEVFADFGATGVLNWRGYEGFTEQELEDGTIILVPETMGWDYSKRNAALVSSAVRQYFANLFESQ